VKVLFVCTGNICRSPTAEGVMRAHLAATGLDDRVQVDSAGTHGYHVGEPPDPRSVATARRHGVELGGLRARKLAVEDFQRFDYLIALDQGHEEHLRDLCPRALSDRVRLLMDFAPGEARRDVPDPYYTTDGFDEVFQMIDRAVRGLVDHIRRETDGA
jgi:protein-tyrosine phosphatase